MAVYVSGDGVSGEVDLATFGGAVLYAAGAGDKVITTGDADTSVNTGAGADAVHLGAGTDVVTFGAGASTVYTGAGSDTFVMHAGATDDAIVGFKGAGFASGEGVKDFLRFAGFSEGSQVVLQDGAGAAHQTYAVVAADGTVESRFAVDMTADAAGAFHSLAAGTDYVLADSTPVAPAPPPAPVVTPEPTPVTVAPDPTPVTVTPDPAPAPVVTPDPTPVTVAPADPTPTSPTEGGEVTVAPPPSPGTPADTTPDAGGTTPAPVATAATLDFDGSPVGRHGGMEQGFQLSDDAYVISSGHVAGLGDIDSPGLLVNVAFGHSTTLLERSDGLAFVLDSLEIDTAARVVLTGHLHGGGDVSTTFAGSGELVLNWGPVDSVSISNVGRAVALPGASALQNASLDAGSRLIELDNIQTHLFF